MIVRSGDVVHDTPLGKMHLHRRLGHEQLAVLVHAIEASDVDWRRVISVRIVEGRASWHTADDELAGRQRHRSGRTIVGRKR